MMAELVLSHPLEPIESPHVEPRIAHQTLEPRKVNNLTLIDGKTFLATSVAGDITPPGAPDVGFFHHDTRFLSELEFRINGHRSVVLSSSTEKTFTSQIELTTGNITLRDSFDLPENTVHIRREQLLSSGVLFDRLTFENFNLTPVSFIVELVFDADFVDVFQVRGVARQLGGQYFRPMVEPDRIVFSYRGRDELLRQTVVRLSPAPDEIRDRSARWNLTLEPLKRIALEATVTPLLESDESSTERSYNFSAQLHQRREAYRHWEEDTTHFSSSNRVFDAALQTCISDFHALQIAVGKQKVIAAGIPWFATIFGRDSIIAAYQTLSLYPQLAKDTLRLLARFQGKKVDDWRDEQPGKILHEHRDGEMTRNGEMPFGPYYGSIDSTPLFLVLLSEVWNWTADEELVRELLPNAYAALEWIDTYGDIDGDGFVEYLRRSPKGLLNQGWKDSWDANMHRDGHIAEPPIALAEVQGYVYDAKYRMASLLRMFGDYETADRLKSEANELQRRFDKAFWLPEEGIYAMALDSAKRPIRVVSSNAGHLLWSRIIHRDRARSVTQRLMRRDVYSGWGIRTLAQSEPVFNPLSYHRGSVWPHDNSLIAHGMTLNDQRDFCTQVLTSLFQAALTFRDYRLPELFCGVQRGDNDSPVHYPVSCSPQAWASGSLFLMLVSVLGIRPSASRRELNIINPQLPDWLDHLHIRNLKIGRSRVGLDYTRRGQRTFCNVVEITGEKLIVNVSFRN